MKPVVRSARRRNRLTSPPDVWRAMDPRPTTAGDDEDQTIAAMQHIQEKKICPRHAWPTDVTAGSLRRTVMPPKIPCAQTSPTAIQPAFRRSGSFAERQSHTAK